MPSARDAAVKIASRPGVGVATGPRWITLSSTKPGPPSYTASAMRRHALRLRASPPPSLLAPPGDTAAGGGGGAEPPAAASAASMASWCATQLLMPGSSAMHRCSTHSASRSAVACALSTEPRPPQSMYAVTPSASTVARSEALRSIMPVYHGLAVNVLSTCTRRDARCSAPHTRAHARAMAADLRACSSAAVQPSASASAYSALPASNSVFHASLLRSKYTARSGRSVSRTRAA